MSRRNEFDQPIGEPVAWSPRPQIGPVTLVGAHVRLEPWSPAFAEDLFASTISGSPASTWTYIPVAPTTLEELTGWLDSLGADPAAVPLVLCTPERRAVGTASYLRLDAAHGSVEVGAIVYADELKQTSAATEAMYLMMRHAFDDLGYRRYEWKCDALNAPSRRAAQRLGFTYEGTFRNALIYKGRNRDTDWFSITGEEWPALRVAYETWLAPANLDSGGRQLRSLSQIMGRLA